MTTTAQSEVGALRKVAVKDGRAVFESAAADGGEWRALNWRDAPDVGRAVDEFERFVDLLEGCGAEVLRVPANPADSLDSIYVRDAALPTDAGVVVGAMAKKERAGEPAALRAFLVDAGASIAGVVAAPGTLEGGDAVWLPGNRLAVGRGYRTNDAGVAQLRELAGGSADEVVVVPLPHWRGPADVFHLMSILSPVADDAVLVFAPLLPVAFHEWLRDRDIRLIEVPDDEFDDMACNVLALAPGKCLALGGNPVTRARLEAAGIEVVEYEGEEISRKGEGGPTCLARPLLRERGP